MRDWLYTVACAADGHVRATYLAEGAWAGALVCYDATAHEFTFLGTKDKRLAVWHAVAP